MSAAVDSLEQRRNGPSASVRLAMHFSMLRIRRVEEAIIRYYPEQEIRCPTHICIGQEAVPAGVSAHLRPADYAFSGHRNHGHYLAKGGDLKAMFAELYGRETGCAAGRGGSQHLIDLDAGFVASAPILAGTIPIAVGAAFGTKRRGLDTVSVIYFGDGATEEGAFHEAMNFASVHQLPVLFVCENNLYSVHSNLAIRQPAGRKISELGKAHGMPGLTADGNDVDAVWLAAGEAIKRARSGGGPSILEFMTYRWLEHCGTNDDLNLGYRARQEFEEWSARCPILRSTERLKADKLLDDTQANAFESDISKEIESAIGFARSSPYPDPASLFNFLLPASG